VRNLHQEITDRIVARLKAGVCPWRQPWSGKGYGVMPRNAVTDRAYSGVNVLLLWSRAQETGYADPRWLTFNQAKEIGANVRKGEKGETVIFMSKIIKEDKDGARRTIPFLKSFTVFNVAQIDNLAAKIVDPDTAAHVINPDARDATIDEFVASTSAVVRHGESRAYYATAGDFINLPLFETFTNSHRYYGTLAHELTHWSGHETRLNRTFGKRFGDSTYAAEELVAELGGAFVCAEFGIDCEEPSAAYLATWIERLEQNDGLLVAAASAASRAVEYLRGLALEDDETPEPLALAA
jgi:antirestriction protein ArdC